MKEYVCTLTKVQSKNMTEKKTSVLRYTITRKNKIVRLEK